MAVYDREEQERVEDLKAWWTRWGNVVSWVAIGVAVVIVGVQGWRYWQSSRAEAASALYFAISQAGRAGDAAKAKDAMATLADQYGGTSYAPRGAYDVLPYWSASVVMASFAFAASPVRADCEIAKYKALAASERLDCQ